MKTRIILPAIAITIAAALPAMLYSGCVSAHASAENNLAIRIANVTKIVNDSPYDVVVSPGKPSFTIEGAAQDQVKVNTKNGTLYVSETRSGRKRNSGGIVVRVSLPVVSSVHNNGSGDVTLGTFKTATFEAMAGGSGDIEIAEIEATRLKLACYGAGDLEVKKLRATSLQLALSGAADIEIGNAESSETDVLLNGAGDISIKNLNGTSVYLVLNGAGDISLSGSSTVLHATLNGAGDISLRGFDASSESTIVNGTGSISR